MRTTASSPTALRNGRYRLIEPIGRGGMGLVFLGHDQDLDAPRAIKLITFEGPLRRQRRRRLRVEARAMARLRHPHVLEVYDVGSEGELDYIVMELASGGSLEEHLDKFGPVSIDQGVRWMLQVLGALSAAHAAGIIHRDVKPANVLLDGSGQARLADFGIALLSDDELRRTRPGTPMGSMAYMPPEQRLDASKVTHQADVYATGATLYHLVTGLSAVDLFLAGASSPRWEGVPEEFVTVLRRACHEDPELRFSSAQTFAEALAPWSSTELVVAASGGVTSASMNPGTLVASGRPRRLGWATVAAALGGVLAILLLVGLLIRTPRPVVESPPSLPAPVPANLPAAPQVRAPVEPEPAPLSVEAPAKVAPVPPTPARGAPPLGRWRMSNNGVQVTIELRGKPSAIRGEAVSRLGGREVHRDLRGSYDVGSRTLQLRETDSGATYVVNLNQPLTRGDGQVTASGIKRAVTLHRLSD